VKFNVYFRFSGFVEVDAPSMADAEHKHGITLDKVKNDLTFDVFSTMLSTFDDFYRCPHCLSMVRYLDFKSQETYYLTKEGKPNDFLRCSEKVREQLHSMLVCDNKTCQKSVPYSYIFGSELN
jgi:hypothetical protein